MFVHLDPHGHIVSIPTINSGWAYCKVCGCYYSRGQLRSTVTDADRQQDLADAMAILAAIDANPSLNTTWQGLTYAEQVQQARLYESANTETTPDR